MIQNRSFSPTILKRAIKLTIIDAETDASRLLISENSAIFVSSSPSEHSYVWEEASQGVFTHFLVEALSGQADVSQKGFVTLNDSFQYVSAKLKSWSAQHPGKQTPVIWQAVTSDIVLVPNKAQTLINIIEASDGELPVVKHRTMEELARLDPETAKMKLAEWIVEPIAYEEWESAVQILTDLDIQTARDALVQALQHLDSGVRWNAASRLVHIADPGSWKALQRTFCVESGAALHSYLYELLTGNPANHQFIIDQHASQFIQNVTPTDAQRTTLLDIVDSLRDSLSRMSALRKAFLDTHLFGSLARGTAIHPISDIDVLVLFQGSPTVEDPKLAYGILESALKRVYKGRVVDKAILRRTPRRERFFSSFGASVIVDLPQGWLEVLPALHSENGHVVVPDRYLRRWIPTNHEAHAEYTEKRDGSTSGLYRSLVKAVKWWQYYSSPRQKFLNGFVLECLVAMHMNAGSDSLLTSFDALLIKINQRHNTYARLRRVPELDVPAGYKITSITRAGHKRFMKLVVDTLRITQQALKADNIEQTLSLWRQAFGSEFPQKLS